GRRLSFTEMIFGAPGKGGFSWGQGNLVPKEKRDSITDLFNSKLQDERFQELMKHESNILNDDCTFSRKNYMK
ncbi:hypothetical protein PMAYCL1PPCAC_14042, partial [Pristionchus mayeri]